MPKTNLKFNLSLSESDRLRFELKIYRWHPPPTADSKEDERGLPRRKAATTIDTATAEEDVKDFDVPGKNLTGFDQVLLLSALCKQARDEVQARQRLSWSDWWVIGV